MSQYDDNGYDRWPVNEPLPQREPSRLEDAETARTGTEDPAYDEAAHRFRQSWENRPTEPMWASARPQPATHRPGRWEHTGEIRRPTADELPVIEVGHHGPAWNGFDTFLRRAAMVAVVALLWTFIVGIIVATVTGAFFMNALSDGMGAASTVDAPYYEDLPNVGDN